MSAQPIVGRVISVSASQLTCLADTSEGDATSEVPIGGLVKSVGQPLVVYGVVNSAQLTGPNLRHRVTVVDLLGESGEPEPGSHPSFQRGVSVSPRLGAVMVAADEADHKLVYAKPAGAAARIGTLHQDPEHSAYVITDDLLAKHFAVLGTTGSGKSCSTALILRAVLEANPHGHVVLLDPHNEYRFAFPDLAEVIDITSLELPFWMLDFEEACAVLVRGGTQFEQESQIAILKEAILLARKKYANEPRETGYITVDTPTPFRTGDLIRIIDGAMGKLDKPDTSHPYLRLKGRLESLNSDARYAFMFSGVMVKDILDEVIARILRVPTAGKPMTIIDLSGVPSEIVDVVVSMLCRMIFDFAVWSDRRRIPPVLVVCEEAHRYVPAEEHLGFASTRKAVSRIAKEGRKYGVSLGLISQRPAELAPSILSQCGTIFALRMGNERDQAFVAGNLPENAKGMMSVLPAMRRQEAIVVGEGVSVPMRIRFDDLPPEFRPHSANAHFTQAWNNPNYDGSVIKEGVRRWRLQIRRSAEELAHDAAPPADEAPAAPGPAKPLVI